jgi:hypothetical protein
VFPTLVIARVGRPCMAIDRVWYLSVYCPSGQLLEATFVNSVLAEVS